MTPDEFQKKCNEIHRIVCYLIGNNNIPKSNTPYKKDNVVWFDIDVYSINCFAFEHENIIEIAVDISDDIKHRGAYK